MRRVFLSLGLVLAVSGLASNAEANTEREKRRKLLPYIYAASQCVATAVGNSPDFPKAVESDQFLPLIARLAPELCAGPLTEMAQQHDIIYGGGGREFLNGPYFSDLDRSVRARLAGRISATKLELAKLAEQRQIEAARAAADRAEVENRARAAQAERVSMAEKVRNVIQDRAMNCIGTQALPMLVTDEKAEVIAKAAMLFCNNEVNALIAATQDVLAARGDTTSPEAIRIAARKGVEDVVTAHVVRAKAELLLKSAPRPANPAPSQAPTL
jgi:hypothetical protein